MTKETGKPSPATTAVIVTDLQGDFTTYKNGSLAVQDTGSDFIDQVRQATEAFKQQGFFMVATQDWHPGDHVSFFTNHDEKKPYQTISINGKTQILWPPHCIQGSENTRLLLDEPLFSAIVKKGNNSQFDSYSGFQDDGGIKTALDGILKENNINSVILYGLATDFCVNATAMDALKAGYGVTVIESLSRGVAPGSTQAALAHMRQSGIVILNDIDDIDGKASS